MSVIDKLASSLGFRTDEADITLAKEIIENNDEKSVNELVENLNHKKKDIQSDCIKTLYEIAERKPELVAPYADGFFRLLKSKNNRLQWGAMTALDYITSVRPEAIYSQLSEILDTAEKGSVITKDHAAGVLIKLAARKEYEGEVFPLLIKQLLKSATNQLPMYAENALPVINAKNKAAFINALSSRLEDIDKDSKRKRLEKVINKAGAK